MSYAAHILLVCLFNLAADQDVGEWQVRAAAVGRRRPSKHFPLYRTITAVQSVQPDPQLPVFISTGSAIFIHHK